MYSSSVLIVAQDLVDGPNGLAQHPGWRSEIGAALVRLDRTMGALRDPQLPAWAARDGPPRLHFVAPRPWHPSGWERNKSGPLLGHGKGPQTAHRDASRPGPYAS